MWKRGFGAGSAPLVLGALLAAGAAPALAADRLGQPTPGAISLQPGVTPLRHEAAFFHDWILLPIIIGISLLVLALLAWVVIRYNAKSNPQPAQFTHNTTVEIIWTAVPVLILMFIAIFSFRLLFAYHNMPRPDLTVKVTGNQWFWNYEYPSLDYAFDSNPLPEPQAEAKGPGLYRLAVDKPMVVPVGKTVQILATGADVLHSFFIPAFGVQTTTIPGRINQTWFKPEKVGVYYGQCNELCGINHSFMPIEVDVVSQADFDTWAASHRKAAPPPAPAPSGAPAAPAPPPNAQAASSPAGATVGPTTGAPAGAAPATPGTAPPAAQAGPKGQPDNPANTAPKAGATKT
jgi:cytochrome c oxidase subunit II